jgi:hypothetical protein
MVIDANPCGMSFAINKRFKLFERPKWKRTLWQAETLMRRFVLRAGSQRDRLLPPFLLFDSIAGGSDG